MSLYETQVSAFMPKNESGGEKRSKVFSSCSLSLSLGKGSADTPSSPLLYLIQMNAHTHTHTLARTHAETAAHTTPQLALVIKRFRSFPGTTVVDQTLRTPPQVWAELHKPVFSSEERGPRSAGCGTSPKWSCWWHERVRSLIRWGRKKKKKKKKVRKVGAGAG